MRSQFEMVVNCTGTLAIVLALVGMVAVGPGPVGGEVFGDKWVAAGGDNLGTTATPARPRAPQTMDGPRVAGHVTFSTERPGFEPGLRI
jgi:hypothetical protein